VRVMVARRWREGREGRSARGRRRQGATWERQDGHAHVFAHHSGAPGERGKLTDLTSISPASSDCSSILIMHTLMESKLPWVQLLTPESRQGRVSRLTQAAAHRTVAYPARAVPQNHYTDSKPIMARSRNLIAAHCQI